MHAASDSDILGSAGMACNHFLFSLSNIHVNFPKSVKKREVLQDLRPTELGSRQDSMYFELSSPAF